MKPNLFHPAFRHSVGLAAAALYVASLMLPAFHDVRTGQPVPGWQALLLGWSWALEGQALAALAWLVNVPAIWLIAKAACGERVGPGLPLLCLAIAGVFLPQSLQRELSGPTLGVFEGPAAGAWLWYVSLVTLAVAIAGRGSLATDKPELSSTAKS